LPRRNENPDAFSRTEIDILDRSFFLSASVQALPSIPVPRRQHRGGDAGARLVAHGRVDPRPGVAPASNLVPKSATSDGDKTKGPALPVAVFAPITMGVAGAAFCAARMAVSPPVRMKRVGPKENPIGCRYFTGRLASRSKVSTPGKILRRAQTRKLLRACCGSVACRSTRALTRRRACSPLPSFREEDLGPLGQRFRRSRVPASGPHQGGLSTASQRAGAIIRF
jgi:hypothetical protein